MNRRTVLDFLRVGQVWEYRATGKRVVVMHRSGRSVVVRSEARGHRRIVLDCSKFRDWYHGLRFVAHPDGSPPTEAPPDPPRCWKCGSWEHVDKDCREGRAVA